MIAQNNSVWPPINQEFDESSYPYAHEFYSKNYEANGHGLSDLGDNFNQSAHYLMTLSKRLLSQGITNFQITETKTPETITTKFHFGNFEDNVTFAALNTPLYRQSNYFVSDFSDGGYSLASLRKAAEQFCDTYDIFAHIQEGREEQGACLKLKFQNAVDTKSYLHARKSGNFIPQRALKIERETRSQEQAAAAPQAAPEAP